jgi:hypothetical protein
VWRLLLRRLPQGLVLGHTLPRLDLRRLQALRVLLRLLVRLLIQRRTRLAQRLRLRSLLHPHPRLLLQLRLGDLAFLSDHLRRVPAFRCGLLQHRARPEGHVPQRKRLARHVLPAHRQHCNVIHHVPARLLRGLGKLVPVRRKACARLVPLRHIVRAARRRVVLVVRQGSVRVDPLRDSRSVLAAAADQAVATIKDQSARSAPARESPRRSQASRFMRVSRQRAGGR